MTGSALGDIDPWPDFQALCRLGGRLCGTPSEEAARTVLADRLRQLASRYGGRFRAIRQPYDGWRAQNGRLHVAGTPRPFEGYPLLRSPATPAGGLPGEVVDLGRGDETDFARCAAALRGRIALVRHEFMFSPDHVHRARKYAWAAAGGAAAFLIAPTGGMSGPIGGGVGFGDPPPIPALGIDADAASALGRPEGARPRVRLVVEAEAEAMETEMLCLEFAGETDDWIVLSAHLDGHGLAESAIDNASGVAAALAAAETVAAQAAAMRDRLRRGLRLCLFSIEEWGLLGSEAYVAGLDAAERRAVALNVNLDSVAGSPDLTALYSGFPPLAGFLRSAAASYGAPLALHEPLVRNSDHYNFAAAGIPACRLLAGFGKPESNMRYVLTPGDTADKVDPGDLERVAGLTAHIVYRACTADGLDLRAVSNSEASCN